MTGPAHRVGGSLRRLLPLGKTAAGKLHDVDVGRRGGNVLAEQIASHELSTDDDLMAARFGRHNPRLRLAAGPLGRPRRCAEAGTAGRVGNAVNRGESTVDESLS